MTEVEIPNGPDELTVDWLSSVFAATGRPAHVAEVEVEPIGTGQTASAYRLSVTYSPAAPELSETFVAKLPSQDPEVRDRVAIGCRSEVAFYETVAATVQIPMPTCFYSAIADEGARFVLLLSDLAPSAQGDQIAGCTANAARAAVVALAGLHGPTWCDENLSSLDGVVVMPRPDAASASGLGEIARLATDMFLEALGPRLTDRCRAVLDASADAVADWLLLEPERFSLLHGDYRLDNILFSPDGDQVHVVDWQTMAVGLPARDLAYFTSTSLTPDDRRAHEDELVTAYFQALVDSGVTGYDLESCREDYRIGMLQAPLISTLGFAFSASTDRGDEMMITMVERACAAIDDLDTLALIRSSSDESSRVP